MPSYALWAVARGGRDVAPPSDLIKRVQRATDATRRGLDRAIDRTAMSPAKALWDIETAQLAKKLRQNFRGKITQEITPLQKRVVLGYLANQTQALSGQVHRVVEAGSRASLRDGVEASSRFLHAVTGEASAIDDPIEIERIVQENLDETEDDREDAVQNLAAGVMTGLQKTLLAAGVLSLSEIIEQIEIAYEKQWWRVERIITTETSRAYNQAQADALELASGHLPGLHQRWTERVHDFTLRPMDNRVGQDSIEMHGQVALPGRVFTMPDDARTRIRGSWEAPPNRPHDRAVLTPWLPEWGLPGWVCQSGQRIPL